MRASLEIEMDKERVRRNFNRYAEQYDHYAVVQRWMGDELLRHIMAAPMQRPPRRILEVGCGTGAVTLQLLHQYPEAHLTVLDLSDRMIEETRKRITPGDQARMTCLARDAESWAKEQEAIMHEAIPMQEKGYDLIVSNATFQWFNHPAETCQALVKLLEPNGVMAFATFGPQTFHELHDSFARAEQELSLTPTPHGQSYLDERAWHDIFTDHEGPASEGLFHWKESLYVMEYPQVEDFLYSVKRVGAGNAVQRSWQMSTSRALFRAMGEQYRQNYAASSGTGIQVTYDVGMGMYLHKQ
ncbi:malonyl-ACP O-methyltransferase BioC [Paenibacillus selenitireducens]|nr:malonyl-ACP O-methyltransferase BioC [Paenibacillus selenitireducens]